MPDLDLALSSPPASWPADGGRSGGFLAGHARAAATSAPARQGAWTVLDQALFSGFNFVVNVPLARWLAPEAFGAFTTAFIIRTALRLEHASARAFAALAPMLAPDAPPPEAPATASSDGSSVSLDHVGFARRTR